MAITHNDENDGKPKNRETIFVKPAAYFRLPKEAGNKTFLTPGENEMQNENNFPEQPRTGFMAQPAMFGKLHSPRGAMMCNNLNFRELYTGRAEIERFFSHYIDTLANVGDQRQGDKEAMADITNSAILLLTSLREFMQIQFEHHVRYYSTPADPFFKAVVPPRLRPIYVEDFSATEVLPLSEYLSRLFQNYPHLQYPFGLPPDSPALPYVGLSDVSDNVHYLMMPRPEMFLDLVGKTNLFLLSDSLKEPATY